MFEDQDFQSVSAVDKRGRKVSRAALLLQHFSLLAD